MVRIELTQGQSTVVDDDDYKLVSGIKWHARWNKATQSFYAIGKRGKQPMHRLIMGNPPGMLVDHKNHDTLDNQRDNLRICTKAQNAKNRKANRGQNGRACRSNYKGVSFHPESGKWRTILQNDGKTISLGLYSSEEDAALAYDRAAQRVFGEYAYINGVPDDGREILGAQYLKKGNSNTVTVDLVAPSRRE